MVAEAILLVVRVVGVRRAVPERRCVVVARTGVGVADDEPYRCTGGPSVEDARQELHLVGFAPGGGQRALPRAAAGHLATHEVLVNGYACRHAVHYATDGRAMRLTVRRQAVQIPERVHTF